MEREIFKPISSISETKRLNNPPTIKPFSSHVDYPDSSIQIKIIIIIKNKKQSRDIIDVTSYKPKICRSHPKSNENLMVNKNNNDERKERTQSLRKKRKQNKKAAAK